MRHSNCLNCGKSLTDKYCSGCGQKADTHRISLKHFIFHDVLHGVMHIEKGMLFTAKQALIRPGKAALDYIAGKRVNYYNIFYFVLILLGVSVVLTHYYNVLATHIDPSKVYQIEVNDIGARIKETFHSYGKLFIFLTVPVLAFNSYLIFRKRRLNNSEHAIISGMFLLGIFLLITIYLALGYLDLIGLPDWVTWLMNEVPLYILVIYLTFVYSNAFGKDYRWWVFALRILAFLFLFALEIFLFLTLLIAAITDWQGGEINFTI
jgi:hypothetical protein